MKLTERQSAVFSNWIHYKVEHPTCHVCQGKEWRIGQLITADTDSVLEDASHLPEMVQLVCRNCAHVLLFDVHGIEGWDATMTPSRSAVM